MDMRGRFARFREETWELPDCHGAFSVSEFCDQEVRWYWCQKEAERAAGPGVWEQRTLKVGKGAELGH